MQINTDKANSRNLEMLYDYIFGNESLNYLKQKYNLNNPFNSIKDIAQKIGLVDDHFDKKKLQQSIALRNALVTAVKEKREFENKLDQIL